MNKIEQAWQSRGLIACLLWPLSLLMNDVVVLRWLSYRLKLRRTVYAPVPVVVVGNISVGGTGKSPLTAALVERFQDSHWRPGIVARGYGGEQIDTPQRVSPTSDPKQVGDEPVMLAKLTGVPVWVCKDRAAAVQALLEDGDGVDIVFSDDGLQHYRMGRNAEIVVVDEAHGFANRWLLPAGPLREPVTRLKSVDLVAVHTSGSVGRDELRLPLGVDVGYFHLMQTRLLTLSGPELDNLVDLSGKTVNAVAGIGDPSRFFHQLRLAGMQVIEHPKPDHHRWSLSDLQCDNDHPIVVTSKDAVKVSGLLRDQERLQARLQEQVHSMKPCVYEVQVHAILDGKLSWALAKLEERLHVRYRQSLPTN